MPVSMTCANALWPYFLTITLNMTMTMTMTMTMNMNMFITSDDDYDYDHEYDRACDSDMRYATSDLFICGHYSCDEPVPDLYLYLYL